MPDEGQTMDSTTERRYTFNDLWDFPDDGRRRELIDGVLYVSPQARVRHQYGVGRLTYRFNFWVDWHGGAVFPGANLDFAADTHLEPDVVFLRPEHLTLEGLSLTEPPDLVIEVSSPSTRRYDLLEKRAAYERFGVPEYWFVDLKVDKVFVYLLVDGRYGEPVVHGRGDVITTAQAPGLVIDVDDVLGPPERG
ncbi:MAG: Uma2 family endonuclease [Egibacteraceae bacterium]